jgi:mono/diheme cytochrome c family protein
MLAVACFSILPLVATAQVEELFKTQCSSCHGLDGSGATTAGKKMGLSDLRSQKVQSLSDDELFQTIAYGVKHKQYPHAFLSRGLTREQVTQLVGYLRKLPKAK